MSISAFSEAKEREIEHSYVFDRKVKFTEELLSLGYAVVAPSGNEEWIYEDSLPVAIFLPEILLILNSRWFHAAEYNS